ncbi:MAG TPA: hypothetical protein VGL93_10680 [Streptosporangiaceae bacterium]|jgi:hypothetical protein
MTTSHDVPTQSSAAALMDAFTEHLPDGIGHGALPGDRVGVFATDKSVPRDYRNVVVRLAYVADIDDDGPPVVLGPATIPGMAAARAARMLGPGDGPST